MLKPLFLGLAFTALVTACTDDYTDWSQPQNHEQQQARSITAKIAAVSPIDLNTIADGQTRVKIFNVTTSGAPLSAFSHNVTLTPQAGLTGEQNAVTLTADSLGTVSIQDLETAVRSFYGKAPQERTLKAAVSTYANLDGQSFRFDSETLVRATPVRPDYAQYLTIHSGGAQIGALESSNFDGYYQGVIRFEVPFTLTLTYKEISQNLTADKFFTLDDDFEGDASQNIVAPAAGLYYAKADLKESGKYTFSAVPLRKVGVIGAFNSWSSDELLAYNAAEGCYQGAIDFKDGGEFKLRFNGTWDVDLGGDAEHLVQGGGNLKAEAGTYVVKFYPCSALSTNAHLTMTKR